MIKRIIYIITFLLFIDSVAFGAGWTIKLNNGDKYIDCSLASVENDSLVFRSNDIIYSLHVMEIKKLSKWHGSTFLFGIIGEAAGNNISDDDVENDHRKLIPYMILVGALGIELGTILHPPNIILFSDQSILSRSDLLTEYIDKN